uniref:AB hydrolase-1 domain-containing protein n=1 Tax=Oryza meridionalis TaxID=40149 RepID=A0A0E0D1H5_9ORYZ
MSSSTAVVPAAAEASSRIILGRHAAARRGAPRRRARPRRASGRLRDDAPTFDDYSRPLLGAVRALPDGERAVLVGHSFGGTSVALAAETFPDKVAAAVFVAALMPDCASPRPDVIEKLPLTDWMDCATDAEHAPPSVLFGPEFMRRKLYQLSPEEDITLSRSLVRDQAIVEAYQRRMIAGCPVEEVREIAAADHMAMFSAPVELAGHLADVANTYT